MTMTAAEQLKEETDHEEAAGLLVAYMVAHVQQIPSIKRLDIDIRRRALLAVRDAAETGLRELE